MYISLNKILKTKIYYNSDLVVKTSLPDNLVNVVFTDGLMFDNFEIAFNQIFFTPSNMIDVYYPKSYYNLTGFSLVNKTQERTEFFRELKERKLRKKFVRVESVSDFKISKSSTIPLLINLSKVQSDITDFITKNKKTNLTLFQFITTVLEKYFSKDLPTTDYKKNIFFIVNNVDDILLKFFIFGLKYKYKELGVLFKNCNIVFIQPFNKLILNLDLNSKSFLTVSNLFSKYLNLVNKFDKDKIVDMDYVEIPKVEVFTEDELLELPVKESESVSHNEDDTHNSENITNKEMVLLSDLKDAKEEDVSKDTLDVRNVSPIEDISFDEITSSNVDNHILKVEKDNSEFLLRMKSTQEKALKEFEEKADLLSKDKTLDSVTSKDDTILNEGSKSSKMNSISLSYYKKQHLKDFVSIIKSLNNDPEYPVVVSKLEINKNSDPLNMQDEVAIQFIDKKGKRHSFVVDVPKLSHDGYLYYNGTKKFITKQSTYLPIIKESDERVQIITNYRKCFIYRKGNKINRGSDRIFRFLLAKDYPGISKVYGNSKGTNIAFDVSLEYNYLASKLYSIKLSKDIELIFNQKNIRASLESEKITPDLTKYTPIGYQYFNKTKSYVILEEISTKQIYLYTIKGKTIVKVANNLSMYLEGLILNMKDDIVVDYKALSNSKSMAYTEIKIASTSVSLAILVAFYKGLVSSLDLYGIKYTIEDKRRALRSSYEIALQFKDQYIFLDSEGNGAKDLFINGLLFLDTKEFEINDTERLGTIYFEYFGTYTGSRNTAKALLNFEVSMIDPITLEILKDLKLPETFVDLVLYGNTLLNSYNRKRKNDMSNFRMRSTEVINVAFYNVLMTAFNNYKRTSKTGIVAPITPASRQAIMKELSENPNVEGYSVLNPFYEIEMSSKTSYKGPSGINSDDAYTAEIRSYDPSMEGLFGFFTPVSAAVGVNRSLSMNPRVSNTRGYLDTNFKLEDATQDNMLTTGELLNVFTAPHADPMRLCMATTQSKHIVPTRVTHSYLVGNGTDKSLAHLIGQDFCFKSSEDGVVDKIDLKLNLVYLKYKDGTTTAIDLEAKPVFNQGSGFYTRNQLELTDGIKVGSKFKKGDIIAANKLFFKPMQDKGSVGFCPGRLSKVAIMCMDNTYEDSSLVTQQMSEDMTVNIISGREIILKKNSKIIKMASIGDIVDVNDPLLIFEEVGDDEKTALDSLDKLAGAGAKSISDLARSTAKSKYAGKIVAMDLLYNTNVEDMHPSLRKVVTDYTDKYKKKAASLKDIRDDELITLPNTNKIDSTKIMGNEMEGILLTFYIEHEELLGVGAKITFFSAVKTIISEVIPEGKEPYSNYHKDEDIDAILTPMSVLARLTPDIMLTGYTNKVLLELKRHVLKDLGL